MEYAGARYYNPQHGRFTSVDPLTASATIRNPQSFNRYSYVLNSPYKFSDPLGLLPLTSAGACGQFCRNYYDTGGVTDFDNNERDWPSFDFTRPHSNKADGPPTSSAEQNEDPPCAEMAKENREEKKKEQQQQEEKSDDEPDIRIETEIAKDLKITKFSVKYIDKDETGQVPIGGKFSITYQFSISTPKEGDVKDLASYSGIVATNSKAFAATENLEIVSATSKVVGTKGTTTIIEKTEVYKVLPDKNSNLARRSGTYAINFFVWARNPESAGGGFVCAGSNSRPGKYIEVRIPPKNR